MVDARRPVNWLEVLWMAYIIGDLWLAKSILSGLSLYRGGSGWWGGVSLQGPALRLYVLLSALLVVGCLGHAAVVVGQEFKGGCRHF